MRYLSKVEITDKIVDIYVNHNCYDEYRSKHDNMTYDSIRHKDVIKECSISFESIKQEAPQCFTDKRENNCKGTVTHFDKKANSVVKKEIYVYSYGEYGHGIFSSFEYLRYSIGSGLDMSEDRDNIPIMGCCGTVKSVGMWD
jgi:hypothetical protein